MMLLLQCVMCGRTAAAQQAARAHVLNLGILILLIPPFLIIGALLWMARRKRKYTELNQAEPRA